jgi:hypothetical protein
MTTAVRAALAGAVLVVLGLLPAAADAQHRSHGQGHGRHHFHHRPLGSRLVVVAPFVPFGYYAAPPVVYASPTVYYAPPPVVYAAPPAYSAPPAYAAPPAPAYAPPLQQDVQPIQREVVFPTGRYVLRGDGVSTPYTWVWIPNPPTAPPGGVPGTPSGSRETERAIYAWTDGNGVTTWTDRLSKVPPDHRAKARREP